jgi:hypothetical protein
MNSSLADFIMPGHERQFGGFPGASLKKALKTVLFITFFPGVLTACAPRESDLVVLDVSGNRLRVEVAGTPEQRARGLMNRRKLADDQGMLFVFDKEETVSFWMKNTRIPLSIAFIAADGTIRQIENMEPYSLESIVSRRSVLYALEVNQGWFSRHGIEVGDRIRILQDQSGESSTLPLPSSGG